MSEGDMRLGVFGGSFNPPHHCHVLAVGLALSCGEVDRVTVIPTHLHPFDKALAPFEDRLEMCRRAFAVFGERVEVSDLEARLPGPSYTVETLRALTRERPGVPLRLILGTDLLDEVERWKDFDAVVSLAPPLWIGREGRDAPGNLIFPFRLPDVSSTEIRRRLATGDAPQALVPAPVLEYIRVQHLYGQGAAGRRILVLGLGKVGTMLARWLAASGAVVQGWDPAPRSAAVAKALRGAGVAVIPVDGLAGAGEGGPHELILVAAPDAALGEVAGRIAAAGVPVEVPALHCSGAAPVRALGSAGRPVGRMHPVFPFASAVLPLAELSDLHVVIEGDGPAMEVAAAAIRDAGGVPVPVENLDAPRYHAACAMAANHLGALGLAAEELARGAGLPAGATAAVLGSLMAAALRNGVRLGFRDSLTGPAVRGDEETLRGHLEAIADASPEVQALYRAGTAALDFWGRRVQVRVDEGDPRG